VCLYLLDVIVRKGATVLKLLSGEDQTLLIRGNSLLVLDLGLDIVDRVGGLDFKGDGLAREGLDEAVVCQSRTRRIHNFQGGGGAGLGELLGKLTSALFETKY
jgi:hypothetical protein